MPDDAAHPTPEAAYRVDVARLPDDASAVLEVWSEALGHAERRPAKLQWFYAQRGPTAAAVLLLRHGARVVGATGIGQRLLHWRGQRFDAALMGDFAVDSRHRTLYPAVFLQRTTLERGLERHALLYGFPNAKSLPVVRRAGYRVLPGMERHARALRSESYLPQILPGGLRRLLGALVDAALQLRHLGSMRGTSRVAWLAAPDARFDALWQRAHAGLDDCVVGVRDRAFLQWRFAPKAWHSTRFFAWLDASGERLLGYAACDAEHGVMQVRDVLVEQPSAQMVAQLLRRLAVHARAAGQRSLSLECSGPPWLLAGLRRAGLQLRKGSRQPMILALAAQAPQQLADACWYMTRADVDE